jgi:recombinational DNA repair protein RecR
MADINKSIQINVEADLKQLLNNLQKMPNMTKKEAQKNG